MKQLRDILGYLLGLVLFVGLMPTLMWLASGKPAFWTEVAAKDYIAWGLMLCGLLLSIWTIVYMKLRGKGNPMDAFGHEVAPRTQYLMTNGPYRLNRNPMLTGTLIYLAGFAVWLWSWQALIVWLLFFVIMFIQVLSEERRLRRDFGNEYDVYCRHTRRFCIVVTIMMLALTGYSQGYRNPVLPGFHADPSVCRAGDDFYLVNSTFQYYPGVPVFHSKDLIHWEQVGACLTRESQVRIEGMDEQTGIYAPTIRYHEGRFYMVTTVFPSRKHFYVYTDNPNGEWSDPVYIDFCVGSCDPTLYFEDGRCYFLWKEGDIKICEIDVKTGKQLGEIHHLGVGLGGRYPEGPHIYKKDGYYYLLLAEGGTEHGHHVNILRSKSLFGPYESNPANPILSHFSMKMQNSPIQGLGHADLVQANDGSWWMICLGYRTHGYLQHVMGRETFLAPVTWKEGEWPVVNRDGTLQLDMQCQTLPQMSMPLEPTRDEFDADKLSLYWSHLNMPQRDCYSLTARKGWLRLTTSTVTLDEVGNPTFIGHRQSEANFSATTKIDVSGLKDGGVAGITAYAAHHNHYDVQVIVRDGKQYIQAKIRIGEMEHIEKEIPLDQNIVYLRITADPQFYHLYYSTDGEQFTHLARMDYRYLSTETIGGFCGVHIGIFAHTLSKTISHADFDWTEFKFQ